MRSAASFARAKGPLVPSRLRYETAALRGRAAQPLAEFDLTSEID